ncbi:MAG: hypothetical protein PHX34_04465 [Candidatus Shapirobacteria bacterium]|nr:hypothetical protein [Candidatus Shapirobacteria bacterium]
MSDLSTCFEKFKQNGIWNDDFKIFQSNFRKWALKNHPDKIKNDPIRLDEFKIMSACKDSLEENHSNMKYYAQPSGFSSGFGGYSPRDWTETREKNKKKEEERRKKAEKEDRRKKGEEIRRKKEEATRKREDFQRRKAEESSSSEVSFKNSGTNINIKDEYFLNNPFSEFNYPMFNSFSNGIRTSLLELNPNVLTNMTVDTLIEQGFITESQKEYGKGIIDFLKIYIKRNKSSICDYL